MDPCLLVCDSDWRMAFKEFREKCCEQLPSILFMIFTSLLCIGLVVARYLYFLTFSVTQIAINYSQQTPSYSSTVFSALIILTSVSVFYFALDAVINENEFQLFGFLLMTLGMTARITYQLVNVYYLTGIRNLFKYFILVPAVIMYSCQIGFFIIVFPVYKSFGWKLYYRVGTSPELSGKYKSIHI